MMCQSLGQSTLRRGEQTTFSARKKNFCNARVAIGYTTGKQKN